MEFQVFMTLNSKDFFMLKITDEIIADRIYTIRGQKVMMDRDLAEWYGVETKRLKEAVKRNMKRFPADFMFQMKRDELNIWRSQFATSNELSQGLRHLPFCFTEQGVAMLSGILNSDRAIKINIQIIRAFVKIRSLVYTHKDILFKVEKLESKVSKHDEKLIIVFESLKKILIQPEKERIPIGFKQKSRSK